jgi:hypothetical protein
MTAAAGTGLAGRRAGRPLRAGRIADLGPLRPLGSQRTATAMLRGDFDASLRADAGRRARWCVR